jgi:ABC-type polysaccharide/polyol phosphate transport system ATPase subunit
VSGASIELAGVGKRYVKYHDSPMLAHALLKLAARTRSDTLWALRDVTLSVAAGECLGVIGRNGSGKSTMLQLLGGITAPTEGTVKVHGRVAPLISVGVGFHPELTGRDNVFLNGTILGMSRRNIERQFDEIAAFAEIGDFIDTPVKFYSSGMQVRLGFAVAVQADPNVLLVDEVLAVGDFAFQVKCLKRIDEIRQAGASVLLVSHNLSMIERLCQRSVVLHNGTVRYDGATAEAIATLHSLLDVDEARDQVSAAPFEPDVADVTGFDVLDEHGAVVNASTTGSRLTARMTVKAHRDIERPFAGLTIDGPRGDVIYHQGNRHQPYPPLRAGEERTYTIDWTAQFPSGSYVVRLFIAKVEAVANVTVLSNADPVALYVQGDRETYGVVDVQADFKAAE